MAPSARGTVQGYDWALMATTTRTRRKRQKRGPWQERHLSCCLGCGAVWKAARRLRCPNGCGSGLRICLTCDRVRPEEMVRAQIERRCAPPAEDVRDFVRRCGGNFDEAQRRLVAAHGDLARAVVTLERSQDSGDETRP